MNRTYRQFPSRSDRPGALATRGCAWLLSLVICVVADAAEITVPIVGYGSGGWKYSIVGWNGTPGFESPSFNDTAWGSGGGPFGNNGCGLPANTAWGLNSDLLVRRWLTVPPNGRIRVAARIDNDAQAFVNGTALSPLTVFEGCGGSERYSAISLPVAGGPTLVAIRARDRGGHSYFDARIEVVFDADCNGDGIVDYVQCRNGTLPDYNVNNVPDCCETGVPCAPGSYPAQWRIEDGGNGNWFRAFRPSPMPTSFAGQDQYCEAVGARMATIHSAAENAFVVSLLGTGSGEVNGALIGFRRQANGSWAWLDGSAVAYVAWGGSGCQSGPYPNNSAMAGEMSCHIYRQNCGWIWDDTPPSWFPNSSLSLVLEWSADCNSDGLVDYGQILDGTFADVNSNGIPDTCDCPGDLNQSGTVDAEDLAYVLFAWGTDGGKTSQADITRDGTVDANDLSVVLGSWGPCP